jgi:hypothetical protein
MPPKLVPLSKFAKFLVDWICTQHPEFDAVHTMLNAKHGQPASRGAANNNTYFLGSIGPHNMAIACLPLGVPGVTSAATVAADMQRTFRDVRVSLLVDDGSGAPSAVDDIQLGNVVVGIMTNDTGSVIQFGLESVKNNLCHNSSTSGSSSFGGANGADGGVDSSSYCSSRYVEMICLNMPPRVLLTALNNLQAEHTLNRENVCDNLAQAAAKYPLTKLHFAAPVTQGNSGNGNG